MVNRLVAFFATGDSIVSNNLVLNLYSTSIARGTDVLVAAAV